MTFPTFIEFFRPFLGLLDRDGPLHMRDIQVRLMASGGFSPEQLEARIPSGKLGVIENRIHWARIYLLECGFVHRLARSTYGISEAGQAMIRMYPERITLDEVRNIPAMARWLESHASGEDPPSLSEAWPEPEPGSPEYRERWLEELLDE